MEKQRFDKIIASQFSISRKDARTAIRKGKCTVDGLVLKDPSVSVSTDSEIVFDGQVLKYEKYIYILMNKPRGVLSASSDKKRQTVVDLVPMQYKRNGLFPVGRLDKDTTGLLIITDDGDFAHKAISPKKNVYKTYETQLDGEVTQQMVESFEKGITLADGTLCRKAFLTPLENNCARIKICEGKYHQIKRMFGTVGLGVNGLKRVSFGALTLPESLDEGECRLLSKDEISSVFAVL